MKPIFCQTKWIFLVISILYSFSNLSLASATSFNISKNKFISYTDVGQGNPLILIHAFPTDQRLWAPQQEGLRNNFRVITLDLLGFGQSSSLSSNAPIKTRMFLQKMMEKQVPSAIASASRGMGLRKDTSNVLSTTKLSVLILTGDQDVVIPTQQSQNMHAIIKNSKLVVIADAGHLSSLEQPEKWDQAVINMFSKSRNIPAHV